MLSCSVKADDFSDKQVILTFIFLVTDWIGLVSGKMIQFGIVSPDIFLREGNVYCVSNDFNKAHTVQYLKDKNSIF